MSSPVEIAVGASVEIVLIAFAAGLLYRVWGGVFAVPQRNEVLGFQRGIILCNGQVERVLNPGRHWITPKRTLLVCDMRSKPFQVPGQELITSDGMGVRISLGGEYRICDPAAFCTESSDSFGSFYLDVRQALLTTVRELNGEAILSGQALVTARVKELLIPRAAQLGIEMTQLDVWEAVPVGWLRQV